LWWWLLLISSHQSVAVVGTLQRASNQAPQATNQPATRQCGVSIDAMQQHWLVGSNRVRMLGG
jgi:hypothetical protein